MRALKGDLRGKSDAFWANSPHPNPLPEGEGTCFSWFEIGPKSQSKIFVFRGHKKSIMPCCLLTLIALGGLDILHQAIPTDR